jgi:hypothetical protein
MDSKPLKKENFFLSKVCKIFFIQQEIILSIVALGLWTKGCFLFLK